MPETRKPLVVAIDGPAAAGKGTLAKRLADHLGLRTVEVPTHPGQGMSLDALELLLSEKRVQAVVTMPSVHNPLGTSMPVAARAAVSRPMAASTSRTAARAWADPGP